ncbi:hypothetical protein BDQ12DRAFT_675343 [Crucibulum laeve]|uniref:Small ribosomal subunit protein bS18m n=1 Tax=Crucibulum laeve TaxID=68775 RepID=A0A5C3MGZ7_9AGAR|nr:hypothetical protein BDQ12DRAFT_675343 [Crucibulum laeve]
MLACFRNALRQPLHSSHIVSRLSTSAVVRNERKATSPMDDLHGMLTDVAVEQEAKGGAEAESKRNRNQSPFTPFRLHSFVRPHELTYKARMQPPHISTRRPAVGPPPAQARYSDPFHQLGIDPLSLALNPAVLAEYVSDMGKIYGRSVTGLTSKSQRRIGKAIRRAKMMGIIPVLSKPRVLTSRRNRIR